MANSSMQNRHLKNVSLRFKASATRKRGVPAIAVDVLAMFCVAFTLLTQQTTKNTNMELSHVNRIADVAVQ